MRQHGWLGLHPAPAPGRSPPPAPVTLSEGPALAELRAIFAGWSMGEEEASDRPRLDLLRALFAQLVPGAAPQGALVLADDDLGPHAPS